MNFQENSGQDSGISLNWFITDEVTTRNTTAYFFGPLCSSCGALVSIQFLSFHTIVDGLS